MKKLLFFLTLTLMTVVGCSKEDAGGGNDEPQKQPEILLNATSSDFKTEGGTNKISFTATEAWSAEAINTRAVSWCSINPTSGPAGNCEISISVTANDTPDNRTASVVIKSGVVSKTIAVSQKQKDALTVTSSKFEVGSDGGEIKIEVKANIDFQYSIDESAKSWVKYIETKAMKTSSLIFEIEKNEHLQKREAKIHIKSGNFNETISIYQAGEKPSIVISNNEYTVTSAGGEISVEVASNVDVAVEMSTGVDWITEDATKAMSTNTYNFNVASNEGYDSRVAEIKFTNKENNISESVKVVQMQKDAIVLAKNSYNIDCKGGQIQIEVGHNVDLGIEISCDWITKVETRAFVSDTIMFNVAENTTSDTREGEIIFSSGDVAQKVKVVQTSLNRNQIKYKSSNGVVVIPNNASAFGAKIISNEYKDGIGVITFDKDIVTVGSRAFEGCRKLSYVELPEGVSSIGERAFSSTGLTTLVFPNSLKEIGDYAFYYSSLKTLILPDSLKEIGNYAFQFCPLTTLTFPEGLEKIGARAFYECKNLISATFPSSLKEIDYGAFHDCSSLTTLTFLNGLTSIGDDAFYRCTNLTTFTLPESLTNIGEYAFYGCTGLTTITLPESLTSVGDYSFKGCSGFTTLALPNSLISIGNNAFENCI